MACRIPFVKQKIARGMPIRCIDGTCDVACGVNTFQKDIYEGSFYALCKDRALEVDGLSDPLGVVYAFVCYADYDRGVASVLIGSESFGQTIPVKGFIGYTSWGLGSNYMKLFELSGNYTECSAACKIFDGEILAILSRKANVGESNFCRLTFSGSSLIVEEIVAASFDEARLVSYDVDCCAFSTIPGELFVLRYDDVMGAVKSGVLTVPAKRVTLADSLTVEDFSRHNLISIGGAFWVLCRDEDWYFFLGNDVGRYALSNEFMPEASHVGSGIALRRITMDNEFIGYIVRQGECHSFVIKDHHPAWELRDLSAALCADERVAFVATDEENWIDAMLQAFFFTDVNYDCVGMTVKFSPSDDLVWEDVPVIASVEDVELSLTDDQSKVFVNFGEDVVSETRVPDGCFAS